MLAFLYIAFLNKNASMIFAANIYPRGNLNRVEIHVYHQRPAQAIHQSKFNTNVSPQGAYSAPPASL